jgi:hypothetical protein
MKWKDYIFILAAGILGFALGILGKLAYENSSVHAYQWKSPPIIVNCYGPDFNEAAMIRAIDYWTMQGYHIGFYVHDPPKSACENEWLLGMIILRKAPFWKLSPDTLASTRRYTSIDQVRGAVIVYRARSFNLDLLNEHELGHALGMTHVEKEGHIMHPLYEKMGDHFDLKKE